MLRNAVFSVHDNDNNAQTNHFTPYAITQGSNTSCTHLGANSGTSHNEVLYAIGCMEPKAYICTWTDNYYA